MRATRALRYRVGVTTLIIFGFGLFAVAVMSSPSSGQSESAPGQCSTDGPWEKALESAPSDGMFATFVYKGVTISTSDGITVDFLSPSENVTGFSVGGGATRTTSVYDPPVSSGSVTAPINPGDEQATISNICIRFGTADTTTTTVETTIITGEDTTTTTTTTEQTVTVAGEGDEVTTTTEAEVLGVVEEQPPALPEVLAFTGSGLSPIWLGGFGLTLMLLGGGLAGLQVRQITARTRRAMARS